MPPPFGKVNSTPNSSVQTTPADNDKQRANRNDNTRGGLAKKCGLALKQAQALSSERQQEHFEYIASQFDTVRDTHDGYMALCPAHPDNNASLHISKGKNGGVVIYCHAGCSTRDVMQFVCMDEYDLMPGVRWLVKEYDYRDEERNLL